MKRLEQSTQEAQPVTSERLLPMGKDNPLCCIWAFKNHQYFKLCPETIWNPVNLFACWRTMFAAQQALAGSMAYVLNYLQFSNVSEGNPHTMDWKAGHYQSMNNYGQMSCFQERRKLMCQMELAEVFSWNKLDLKEPLKLWTGSLKGSAAQSRTGRELWNWQLSPQSQSSLSFCRTHHVPQRSLTWIWKP